MRATLILAWALLLSATALRAEEAPCQVHVILFVPADVAPSTRYQPRVDEIVGYAESFLQRELKRWGHENVVMPFRRTADGHVEVATFRGKQKTGQYKPVTVRAEVMDALRQAGQIKDQRQIWWILVYPGDPPKRFSAFLGGFGEEIGGWAVGNFDTSPGRIDPKSSLTDDYLEKIALKGILHELGHGFRLPHVGPLSGDPFGNTLMGPTHYNFKRVAGPQERGVGLSRAEAAMLAMHPAFRGLPDLRSPLPKVQATDLKYAATPGGIVVSGTVKSDQHAVYALVADESEARPGEYWTKTYVGEVRPDGTFEVTVSEPAASNGKLKTWFIFENGAHTGDGKGRSRDSGIAKAYVYRQGQRSFE
jgi:hypothetical protein